MRFGPASLMITLGIAAYLFVISPTNLRAEDQKIRLYVGTYTGKNSKGIYRFDFDPAPGKLTGKAVAVEIGNPSFLAIHPNKQFLYAVGESGDFEGKKTGAVNAFKIDAATGDLKLLNQ